LRFPSLVGIFFTYYHFSNRSKPNFGKNTWSVTGISSPYSHVFSPGGYSCTFEQIEPELYYNKTVSFVVDNDTTIDIVMSKQAYLTIEEHTWLEAIYNCLYEGDCLALNLLFNINQTTTKMWNQFKRTDQMIVTNESIISKVVNATSNLTINYSVNVPIKEGYGVIEGLQGHDDFLPIKLAYWFLDETNTSCYNQGDKPTGVETPYCNPLIIQTVGQINTTINFTVDLRPSLPSGNYTIVRSIEIDPNNVWTDYGQEIIGKVEVLSSGKELINLKYTGEIYPELTAESTSSTEIPSGAGITGLATLLTSANISLIISLITLVLVGYLVVIRKKY